MDSKKFSYEDYLDYDFQKHLEEKDQKKISKEEAKKQTYTKLHLQEQIKNNQNSDEMFFENEEPKKRLR